MQNIFGRIGIAGALCSGVAIVSAEEPRDGQRVIGAEVRERETGWEGDHLTGTWGGLRTELVERGVHFQAGYIGEVFGNVSGGTRQGAAYQGLLELGVDLDSERLGLWQGGTLHLSSLFPHGRPFSEGYVGDLLTVSNIEAYESFRLYEAWYEHVFREGEISVRAGQLVADDEFAYTEPGGYFVNSSFGWPAFISGNTINTGPAYFVTAPGIRVRYEPTGDFFIQAGIYDGDTFDSRDGDPKINASGTRMHLSDEQGLFAIAEAGFRINKSHADEGSKENHGLPGEYQLGAWLHTGDFQSNYEDAEGRPFVSSGREPREHGENFGVYVSGEQMLWRENGSQGLYAFARAGASPRDRSLFEFAIDGGLVYQGLIAGRETDIIGVGAAHARVSRDIRSSEKLDARLNGAVYAGRSDHETALEMFYLLQLNKWWTLQPDFQWIFDPGGAEQSDAVVVGLRTSIVF